MSAGSKALTEVLVVGANGQLGSDVLECAAEVDVGLHVTGIDIDAIDIRDPASIASAFDAGRPAFVINCSAYTAVDAAESDADAAFAVNADGAGHLARACAGRGIPIVQISTDYVFAGDLERDYLEDDVPQPLSVYGESKWRGEELVREAASQHLILRVSWLFGVHGQNFVRTIRRLARERTELRIIGDQYGGPTPSWDLAGVLLDFAARYRAEGDLQWGTYHYSGKPATSWHAFASAIVEELRGREELAVESVTSIATEEYPLPAARPGRAVLSTDKIRETFGLAAPDWRAGLERVIDRWLAGDSVGSKQP